MCRNGRYTEHGIKELNGFAREGYRLGIDKLIKVDPSLGDLGILFEPTSAVAKAWEQAERVGQRAQWAPQRALVIGAGPIGLLAALLGVQRTGRQASRPARGRPQRRRTRSRCS